MLRRVLLVLALALAGQALPSLAAPSHVVRPVLAAIELPTTPVPLTTERLVGVTWSGGSPEVTYRWHTPAGWSAWQHAEDDSAASPQGTPGTEPLWRPPTADLIQLRTTGAERPRLVRVFDGASSRSPRAARAQSGRAILGAVRSRADWGADESIKRGRPSYAARVDAVVVHHTANANGYRPEEVPAVIRADYAYHVQARGWADLGYNLLVDQFGVVWEGRAGGLGRATVGAHAEGFNTGTLGVALIGDLTKVGATNPAERALARVIAHAAATWRFDPTRSVTLTSGGSPRFPKGRKVSLPRAFGHGQTSSTACPGSLQGRLPTLRALARIGLGPAPVISRVDVTGAPVHAPKPARIEGQLSRSAGWTVTVHDPQGTEVARATGTGTAPALTWDGTNGLLPVLPGSYRWRVTADNGFHDPAVRSGELAVGLPLVG